MTKDKTENKNYYVVAVIHPPPTKTERPPLFLIYSSSYLINDKTRGALNLRTKTYFLRLVFFAFDLTAVFFVLFAVFFLATI